MQHRACSLLNFVFIFLLCDAEYAMEFVKFFNNPIGPIEIRRNHLAASYLRGFPAGSWGTRLFPATGPMITSMSDDRIEWEMFDKIRETGFAVGDYFAYVRKLKNIFCEHWHCCAKKTQYACEAAPSSAHQVMDFLIDPYLSLPLSFAIRWCPQAWQQYRELKDKQKREMLMLDIELYCPDPCRGNPCRDLNHVNDTSNCTVTGPFENDYICDCNKYSLWDPALSNCQLINPCQPGSFSPCHPENTLMCIAKGTENTACICKPEYMGSDCSVYRDSCQERLNKSKPNGYELCQVQYGNECHPILGTDAFRCRCQFGYAPTFTTTDDNCLTRLNSCTDAFLSDDLNDTFSDMNEVAKLIGYWYKSFERNEHMNHSMDQSHRTIRRGITCLNGGQCISSSDLTRSICVCLTSTEGDQLFKGLNCEIPVGQWSPWSAMSPCLPSDCGVIRYRWHRRRCLNVTSSQMLLNAGRYPRGRSSDEFERFSPAVHCIGTSEEVLPCEPLDQCMKLRLPGYLREEFLNYETLYYFSYITAAHMIFSVLSWFVFVTPIRKFISHKKIQSSAVVVV